MRGSAAVRPLTAVHAAQRCPSHCPSRLPGMQSEDPDYKWVLTVMGFWLQLFAGLLGLALSICWVLQIILYILIDPPVTPLLNDMFIK